MLQMEVAIGITSQDALADGVENFPGLCLEQDCALQCQSDAKRRRVETTAGLSRSLKQQAAIDENEDEEVSTRATVHADCIV